MSSADWVFWVPIAISIATAIIGFLGTCLAGLVAWIFKTSIEHLQTRATKAEEKLSSHESKFAAQERQTANEASAISELKSTMAGMAEKLDELRELIIARNARSRKR